MIQSDKDLQDGKGEWGCVTLDEGRSPIGLTSFLGPPGYPHYELLVTIQTVDL
jgi:hypothetical protein